MPLALLVRLRPAGPWRLGPADGSRSRSDTTLHSDTLYSALLGAMHDLGHGEEWIAATMLAQVPGVRISSGYPFAGQHTFIQPPRTVWPPAQSSIGKVRWELAKYVPLNLVRKLFAGEHLNEDQWIVDPESECLLPLYKSGPAAAPFRRSRRTAAPVDRVTGVSSSVEKLGVLEFGRDSGLWFLFAFSDDETCSTWNNRLRGAVRLLADTGIGGGRSRGWGRSAAPKFENVDLHTFLPGEEVGDEDAGWWTLSLFSPAESEAIDWNRGNYGIVQRSGRSSVNGDVKPVSRMVAEGSVLTGAEPRGTVLDLRGSVRSGLALAVRIAYRETDVWRQFERSLAVEAPPVPEEVPAEPVVPAEAAETFTEVPAEVTESEQQPVLEPPQLLLDSPAEPIKLLEAPHEEPRTEEEPS